MATKEVETTLLSDLATVDWGVAARTYGNAHSTFIGLLVRWWISGHAGNYWALDGGPSFGRHKRGTGGGGQCDAVLCRDGAAVGIVEVEGTRPVYTVEKVGKFFGSACEDLHSLEFAIILLYAYSLIGRGEKRDFVECATPEVLQAIQSVSRKYPTKPMVLITLEKTYSRPTSGIRRRTEYYWGAPCTIRGFLFREGQERGSQVYYSRGKG
jgi:hypothetical protein